MIRVSQSILDNLENAKTPVIGISSRVKAGKTEPHSHSRAQLMFAAKGTICVTINSATWVLPANRAIWIPPHAPHSLSLRKPIEMSSLYFDENLPWIKSRSVPTVLQVSALMKESILEAVKRPWDYVEASATMRLMQFLSDLVDDVHQEPLHLTDPTDLRALRLSELYRANLSERRSIEELATVVGASARTLDRLFMSQAGMTVGRWIKQLRLMRALEELADGLSVNDVSYKVGFESPSSFIAIFKKQFGVTPGRYFSI